MPDEPLEKTFVDPLGEALQPLQMTGVFYCRSELSEPWGMELMPLPGYAWFHVITEGSAELDAEGETRTLHRGELALVPHGTGHTLRSSPGTEAPPILDLERERISDRYEVLRHGGGGQPSRMICGAIRFEHPSARGLIDLLPAIVQVGDSVSSDGGSIRATLGLIAAETVEPQPGGEAVVTRLADILVIQTIRSWIETDPGAQSGWLGALRDPRIGRSLNLIHTDPGRDWTVASLAREVAMSRSAFAARFTELVGVPALRYLTEWRMGLARDRLEAGDVTVGAVAEELGHGSEAAFSRAFKRITGFTPGAVPRRADAWDYDPAPTT